jgi:hypothetical protein
MNRLEWVLTMVYNTQNCWVFGLCLSTGVQQTRKHNVSETGSVSVKWEGVKTPLEGAINYHLRAETDPASETFVFLVSRIQDDGHSPKTQ